MLKEYNIRRILRKCTAHWWGSRTSNPVWGANTVPGGFDSHALPPHFTKFKFCSTLSIVDDPVTSHIQPLFITPIKIKP